MYPRLSGVFDLEVLHPGKPLGSNGTGGCLSESGSAIYLLVSQYILPGGRLCARQVSKAVGIVIKKAKSLCSRGPLPVEVHNTSKGI